MNYRGIAAIIIAGTVGGALLATVIGLAVMDRQLGEVGGDALIALGGALVGALATYLGQQQEPPA
jgi:hypothetical protein